jgi:hypothetical protein
VSQSNSSFSVNLENTKGEGFKDVASQINAKHPSVSFQVFVERFGNYGTVCLQADYKDLASLESIKAQIQADQEYRSHVSKAAELLIEGSTHETLLSSV